MCEISILPMNTYGTVNTEFKISWEGELQSKNLTRQNYDFKKILKIS